MLFNLTVTYAFAGLVDVYECGLIHKPNCLPQSTLNSCECTLSNGHRGEKEIDCSLAVVGREAAAAY